MILLLICTMPHGMPHTMPHTCPPRQEIREMKAELREVRSTQDEILRVMQAVLYRLTSGERNMPGRSEGSQASGGQEGQVEIVVAGGDDSKSVETYNMTTKTWRPLSKMNERRVYASSVVYQDRMIVTGGLLGMPNIRITNVEELNLAQQNGHWIKSPLKLPFQKLYSHVCVLYQNRLLVIGGQSNFKVYATIFEIQLTPPYTWSLVSKMPRPIYVQIVLRSFTSVLLSTLCAELIG